MYYSLNYKNLKLISCKDDIYRVCNEQTKEIFNLNKKAVDFLLYFKKPKIFEQAIEELGFDPSELKLQVDKMVEIGFLEAEGTKINHNSRIPTFESSIQKSSFFDSHYKRDQKQIGLLGIPYDGAVTGSPGQRLAPNRVRKILSGYKESITRLDNKTEEYTLNIPIFQDNLTFDLGNIAYIPGESSENFHARVQNAYTEISKQKNGKVLSIGGDHSITNPIIKSIKSFRSKPFTLVKIDAHYDTYPLIYGQPVHHANFISDLIKGDYILDVIHLGIREAKHPSLTHTLNVISSQELMEVGWQNTLDSIVKPGSSIYLSIDIDVLDPSESPGTSFQLPFGISIGNLLGIIRHLILNYDVLGYDVVELNPLLDVNRTSIYNVIKIIDCIINTDLRSE